MQTPQTSTLDFAVDVAERTACAVFGHYGVDVHDHFNKLRGAASEPVDADSSPRPADASDAARPD